uniref:Uncharacterized protein n=1 Tax=Anguilla anguilla TaxID=7936 RepID=A0A0E9TKK4_ANGAN
MLSNCLTWRQVVLGSNARNRHWSSAR